jgi:hypothetical protein
VTTAQVSQFLNIVFLAIDPQNNEIYYRKDLSMKQILSVVWNYSTIFDEKTITSFGRWCTSQKLEFTTVNPKRKHDNDGLIRTRELFVLKDEYIGNATRLGLHN